MQAIPRAIFFIALATFFLVFAITMEPQWGRTMLFAFAGIDYVWGSILLISALKNKNKK
jgi:hypothetical protein